MTDKGDFVISLSLSKARFEELNIDYHPAENDYRRDVVRIE